MSKLVKMDEFRQEHAADRGFAPWRKLFGDMFTADTRYSDLQDSTIATLAEPGEESAGIFYAFIMGVLDLGNVPKFDFLKPAERLTVVDTHLLLADLVRYEVMRRIDWIGTYPDCDTPLTRLVMTFDPADYSRYANPPQLLESHTRFEEFRNTITREKLVMLRQLFGEALVAFKIRF